MALAKALNLKVTLLRAVATAAGISAAYGYGSTATAISMPFQPFEEMAKSGENQALDYLKKLEESLRGQGVESVDHRMVHGSAAQVIVDIALETPDNLVAMTTHGRSGLARSTLGSVTDRVVCHSEDPVLVIRVRE